MISNLNKRIQAWIPILTPLCVVIGVLFYQTSQNFIFLVSWLLAFMTFSSSLGMKFRDMKSFLKYPFVILCSITLLHIIMPFLIFFLSTLLFDDYLLIIGFVIAASVPTGISSIIWINICKGDLPLGIAIILIDSLISPIIIPSILYISFGKMVSIDIPSMMLNLLYMIVLPTLLGMLMNKLIRKDVHNILHHTLSPFAKLSLLAIILINSSAIAPYLSHITWHTVYMILIVFLISVSSYVIALIIGYLLWSNTYIITTFVFTGGMRNIALGIILATSFFPKKVAMPVVFGMLFQQILASIFSKIINKYNIKSNKAKEFNII